MSRAGQHDAETAEPGAADAPRGVVLGVTLGALRWLLAAAALYCAAV